MQLRKPALNFLEAPVPPNITRNPPQYVNSKKYWTVDVGETVRREQDNDMLLGNAILAVDRTANIRQYGVKSYTHKVNKAFRPPIIDSDLKNPLSRLPRPQTSAISFKNRPFEFQNTGEIKCNPKLFKENLSIKAANFKAKKIDQVQKRDVVLTCKRDSTAIPGKAALPRLGPDLQERQQLACAIQDKVAVRPSLSVPLRAAKTVKFKSQMVLPITERDRVNPLVNVDSGQVYPKNWVMLSNGPELQHNRTQVGVASGMNNPLNLFQPGEIPELSNTREPVEIRNYSVVPFSKAPCHQEKDEFITTRLARSAETEKRGLPKARNMVSGPEVRLGRGEVKVNNDFSNAKPNGFIHRLPTLRKKKNDM